MCQNVLDQVAGNQTDMETHLGKHGLLNFLSIYEENGLWLVHMNIMEA